MGNFHTIVILVGTVVIAFTLAFSIVQRKGINSPFYLKNFYIYPLIVLLISLNTLIFSIFPAYKLAHAIMIEKMFVLVDFIFWSLFFSYLLQDKVSAKVKDSIHTFFLTMLIIVLIIIAFSKNAYQPLGYANMGKCIMCIFYFYGLFKSPPNLSLWHEPSFWIVTGLLFYSTISTPIYLSIDLFFYNDYTDLIGILFPITNITIIIMHLLFLKGYSCTLQRPKI